MTMRGQDMVSSFPLLNHSPLHIRSNIQRRKSASFSICSNSFWSLLSERWDFMEVNIFWTFVKESSLWPELSGKMETKLSKNCFLSICGKLSDKGWTYDENLQKRQIPYSLFGFTRGNSTISRRFSCPMMSVRNRSIPNPRPDWGGMAYSIARTKS